MATRKKTAPKRKAKKATARVKTSVVVCECRCHRTLGGKLVCPKCFVWGCKS